METSPGCCLNLIAKWIWLFTLTCILRIAKAEVRCIPSCQLTIIKSYPRELPELDVVDFGEIPADELIGFTERLPGSKSMNDKDQNHIIAEFTRSEEISSFQPQESLGNNSNCLGKDALNGAQKLSHSEVSNPNSRTKVLPGSVNISTKNGSINRKTDRIYKESRLQSNVLKKNKVPSSSRSRRRRRKRSTQMAEGIGTWSGFRWSGEDASSSGQPEFQLTSSTFALTGDSAHNQAMVHWSGQNSSVSN